MQRERYFKFHVFAEVCIMIISTLVDKYGYQVSKMCGKML